MKTLTEIFYFNGSFILELSDEYIPSSVKAWYYESDSKLEPISLNEIGGRYIGLDEEASLEEGMAIKVEYAIETKKFSTEKLNQLEARVAEQQKVIETILEALKHRVDIHTFSTYLRTLESKLNIDILDEVFTKPYPS